MASLASPGIGSGLDINSLVSKLMAYEQQPLIAMQRKEAGFQAKISALGSLKSALSALQTAAENLVPGSGTTAANKFTATRAGLSDTSLATASANNTAAAGNYTLSEITLAAAQQVRKSGFSIPAAAGTLSITVGTGTAVEVAIGENATLASIRDAINTSSAGVTASIINDGSSDYLVLTGKNSGLANTIAVTGSAGFESFNYSSGSANSWTEAVPAANASLKVNGILVTSDKNSITTAIEGVTLNLTKATTGSVTLSITKDYGSVNSGLTGFVKAYNDAMTTIKNLGAVNKETGASSILTGDSALRSIEAGMRSMFFAGAEGQRLSDIGISLQLDGSLKLDSSKLTTATSNNFEQVASLVAAAGTRFKTSIAAMVDSSGIVTNRIEGLKASIKTLDQRQEAFQLRLEKVESNYRRQFTALDVQLANMQSLSSRLGSMLSSIPQAGSLNSSN